MLVGLQLGNQIGEAYVKRDLIRDLKVIMRVSFCWSQLVPAIARRMLRRVSERWMIEVT